MKKINSYSDVVLQIKITYKRLFKCTIYTLITCIIIYFIFNIFINADNYIDYLINMLKPGMMSLGVILGALLSSLIGRIIGYTIYIIYLYIRKYKLRKNIDKD